MQKIYIFVSRNKNMRMLNATSFRYKIFFAIIGVNLLFMIAMASFDLYKDSAWQNSEKKLHLSKVENRISLIFEKTMRGRGNLQEKLDLFQQKIATSIIADNISISIYDPNGKGQKDDIENNILHNLYQKEESVFIKKDKENERQYHLYRILYAQKQPVAILNISERTDSAIISEKMQVIIKQYLLAMLIMFVISAYIAWFISQKLMKRLNILTKQLPKTNIEYLDTPILEYQGKDEVSPLIASYNTMLIKLKDQAERLAQTEREESWRVMAEQIIHDIRNPLTPLKLSVQNFQRRYDPNDENNPEKIKKLTETVMHQVDTIYEITQSFSEFANAPLKNESIDVVKVLRHSLDIFPENIVSFQANAETLEYDKINETHFTRVITNIVKNAIQAIPHHSKKVEVFLNDEGNKFSISIKDNGNGIAPENRERIFERKFTTKSSGTGVGLFIVKKIIESSNGRIWFETEEGKGTIFYVEFYKTK